MQVLRQQYESVTVSIDQHLFAIAESNTRMKEIRIALVEGAGETEALPSPAAVQPSPKHPTGPHRQSSIMPKLRRHRTTSPARARAQKGGALQLQGGRGSKMKQLEGYLEALVRDEDEFESLKEEVRQMRQPHASGASYVLENIRHTSPVPLFFCTPEMRDTRMAEVHRRRAMAFRGTRMRILKDARLRERHRASVLQRRWCTVLVLTLSAQRMAASLQEGILNRLRLEQTRAVLVVQRSWRTNFVRKRMRRFEARWGTLLIPVKRYLASKHAAATLMSEVLFKVFTMNRNRSLISRYVQYGACVSWRVPMRPAVRSRVQPPSLSHSVKALQRWWRRFRWHQRRKNQAARHLSIMM